MKRPCSISSPRGRARAVLLACLAGLLAPAAALAQHAAPSRIADLRATLADPHGRVMVAAHRGCWKDSAENSLAAIATCRELGVDIVELDVRRTADGVLVLMHDARIDRTTTGRGEVARLTLAELRRFRLRHGAGGGRAAATALQVPTLAEALEAARGAVLVNLDMKDATPAQVEALLVQMDMLDQVVTGTRLPLPTPGGPVPGLFGITQYKPVLKQRAHADVAALWPVLAPLRPAAVEIVFSSDAWFRDSARLVSAQGSRVLANTMAGKYAAGHTDARALRRPAAQWGRLLDLGASIIQTDEPEGLLAYIATRTAAAAALAQAEGDDPEAGG